ncbi:cyclic GMP-AMP phosphodiesterase SMPDL3A [Scleropages formosus]|uniref:Acid sphingomyelinase-like phosphodiesterase n=1 Tax=Scleropages formosus TaxID=113540 RepID=A0A8C9SWW8_SCLFO|nr:acid sphingomyelinase-like phosphodiesterase 3a [Scleropages formosus]
MDRRLCVHLCCLLSACALAAVSGAPIQSAPVTGKFWHISDLHLDATYHVSEDHSQVCLSSKGHEALNPGEFGDYMCDSPYELILSAFDFMKRSGQLTDFIIWTGDSPPHFLVEKLSTDIVVQILSNMTSTIRKYFPELMVYPALGNHDYWPQDQFPNSTNKIYQAAADLWEPWLKTEAIKTLRAGGFYSQLVQPGLRVVSLNTNLYYSPNKVTTNMTDPAGQFRWLMETLESSRQNAEKVYIIAHVPIGYLPQCNSTTAMREVHNERLVQIFRKYGDVIAGQFYGHTHRDSVMVLLDDQGKPVSSVFVTPAVTPIKDASEPYSNNPGVRLYKYDPRSFGMLDVVQYFLNLTEANEERKADWKLEYVMTEAFDINDVEPQSLQKLARSFAGCRSEAFQKYFNHFMVSYDDTIVCQGLCKTRQVCAVQFLDSATYSQCVEGRLRSQGLDHNFF